MRLSAFHSSPLSYLPFTIVPLLAFRTVCSHVGKRRVKTCNLGKVRMSRHLINSPSHNTRFTLYTHNFHPQQVPSSIKQLSSKRFSSSHPCHQRPILSSLASLPNHLCITNASRISPDQVTVHPKTDKRQNVLGYRWSKRWLEPWRCKHYF